MPRVVAITPDLLIKLCHNEEFRRRQPSFCSAILGAPGQGYKCCPDRESTIWAKKYWESLKKRVLRLDKKDIIFIKEYIGADQLYISYECGQQKVHRIL